MQRLHWWLAMHIILMSVYSCISSFCLGDRNKPWLCSSSAPTLLLNQLHAAWCLSEESIILEPTSKMPALLMSPCNGSCFQCCAKLLTDCREETSSSMTSALGLMLPCSSACSSKNRLSFSPRPLSRQANMTAGNTTCHSAHSKHHVADANHGSHTMCFATQKSSRCLCTNATASPTMSL